MERVSGPKDLAYKTTGMIDLRMDLYYPLDSQDSSPYPAVIFVHGDAPLRQNVKSAVPYVSWGQLVAASGIAGVAFNWRYDQVDDIVDLIQYVRDNAEMLRIDKDRLCIFAFSAGVAPGISAIVRNDSQSVRCMVAYYGDMRLPLAQVQEGSMEAFPPLLIARAAQDEFIPSPSIDGFVEKASAKGLEVELLVHPSGVHAFDLRNDDDLSREIIQETIEFFQAHLDIREGD